MKTKFVVINENIFGYINPIQPDYVGVLSTSIIRGAVHGRFDGPYLLSMAKTVRLATLKDFDDFLVSCEGYQKDTVNYDCPKE